MNQIFDTHAHYDSEEFNQDQKEVLSSLPGKNVFAVITAGTDINSSETAVEISKNYEYIFSAVGIHPENIHKYSASLEYLKKLKNLVLNNKKVVAIGEIGLDYHFNRKNKEMQKSLFENQIQLALSHDLPIIVHDRDAHSDTLEILKKYKPKGMVHCFSGSIEMANEVIGLGLKIGIGGVVTFKNAKNIVDIVQNTSLSQIVLETDAPYLSPVPFRGKRCDSSYIQYTAEKIAEIKKISVAEVLQITKENAISLFNITN